MVGLVSSKMLMIAKEEEKEANRKERSFLKHSHMLVGWHDRSVVSAGRVDVLDTARLAEIVANERCRSRVDHLHLHLHLRRVVVAAEPVGGSGGVLVRRGGSSSGRVRR